MPLLLGLGVLLLLWGVLATFARADVASVRALLRWIAVLAAVVVGTGLVLTGREGLALAMLPLIGPSLWSWWRGQRGTRPGRPAAPRGAMTRAEAYEVLGLQAGASAREVKAAHLRLMQGAHPDHGGSDWLATRINQARDVLLG